jgi:hypothetical protein
MGSLRSSEISGSRFTLVVYDSQVQSRITQRRMRYDNAHALWHDGTTYGVLNRGIMGELMQNQRA